MQRNSGDLVARSRWALLVIDGHFDRLIRDRSRRYLCMSTVGSLLLGGEVVSDTLGTSRSLDERAELFSGFGGRGVCRVRGWTAQLPDVKCRDISNVEVGRQSPGLGNHQPHCVPWVRVLDQPAVDGPVRKGGEDVASGPATAQGVLNRGTSLRVGSVDLMQPDISIDGVMRGRADVEEASGAGASCRSHRRPGSGDRPRVVWFGAFGVYIA